MRHRSRIGLGICALFCAASLIAADDADNTGRNVRDRDDSSVTPIDQGSGEADIEVTRSIRKAVVSEKEFSAAARNVKIITRDGVVTLRGPVETITEKMRIGELAAQPKGVRRVDNEIEVTVRE